MVIYAYWHSLSRHEEKLNLSPLGALQYALNELDANVAAPESISDLDGRVIFDKAYIEQAYIDGSGKAVIDGSVTYVEKQA